MRNLQCLLAAPLLILNCLARLAIGGTITSINPNPPPPAINSWRSINQPISDATGASLNGALVFYAYEIGPDTYAGDVGIWSRTGEFSGGLAVPQFTVSLDGDSHAQPFNITNTGSTPLLVVSIENPFNGSTPGASVVFDISSHLASGSTTDAMNGIGEYQTPAYPGGCPTCDALIQQFLPLPNTPYFAAWSIRFDDPGLSPGASATVFADADFVVPEPGSVILMGSGVFVLAMAAFLTRRRRLPSLSA